MRHILKGIFRPSGRKLFFHNTVILLLFFGLCRLYRTGFGVCLLAFVLGQVFLVFSELVYVLLVWLIRLIREVLSFRETDKNLL